MLLKECGLPARHKKRLRPRWPRSQCITSRRWLLGERWPPPPPPGRAPFRCGSVSFALSSPYFVIFWRFSSFFSAILVILLGSSAPRCRMGRVCRLKGRKSLRPQHETPPEKWTVFVEAYLLHTFMQGVFAMATISPLHATPFHTTHRFTPSGAAPSGGCCCSSGRPPCPAARCWR